MAALEAYLEILALKATQPSFPQRPKLTDLRADFPRMLFHHRSENTCCLCGCTPKHIVEDSAMHAGRVPRCAARSWQVDLR
jgi:hypothetical protein